MNSLEIDRGGPQKTFKCNDSSGGNKSDGLKNNIWETTMCAALSVLCKTAGEARKAPIHQMEMWQRGMRRDGQKQDGTKHCN